MKNIKKYIVVGLVTGLVTVQAIHNIRLNEVIAELETVNAQQSAEIIKYKESTSAKEEENSRQREALEQAVTEVSTLMKSIEDKQAEIDSLNGKIKGLEKEVQDLEYVQQKILNSVGYIPSKAEIDLLERLVYCEAGNQSLECQIAVVNVVLNRVKAPEFPDTITEVVNQSGQFSPVGSGWIKTVEATAENKKAVKLALTGRKEVSSSTKYFFATWLDKNHKMWDNVTITRTIGEVHFGVGS